MTLCRRWNLTFQLLLTLGSVLERCADAAAGETACESWGFNFHTIFIPFYSLHKLREEENFELS
jgi:hypothetical protein